jgi:hypothetical protein
VVKSLNHGNAHAVAVVQSEAARLGGEVVGPHEGPYTSTMIGHLTEPTPSLFVITSVFVEGRDRMTGEVPERPPIPPGAIG